MFDSEQPLKDISFFSTTIANRTFYDNEIGPDGRPLSEQPGDEQYDKVPLRPFNEAGTMSSITIVNMSASEIFQEVRNMVAYLTDLQGKSLSDYTKGEVARAVTTSESVLRWYEEVYRTGVLAGYADDIRSACDAVFDSDKVQRIDDNNVIDFRQKVANG